jgi:hypothetical protein
MGILPEGGSSENMCFSRDFHTQRLLYIEVSDEALSALAKE